MLIDTHCHLDFSDYDKDRDEVISRARQAGIGAIINIGTNLESSSRCIELAKNFDLIFATIGVHPHYADALDDKALGLLNNLADFKKVIAVGEVGLDYYKSKVSNDLQKRAFISLIRISKEKKLPLIIHNRDAHRDILDILKAELHPPIRGVIHCFSGDENFLKDCLDSGLYISFTCNLTYKKTDRLRQLARQVPLDRLFLETDAPFLSPQNFRGKRNEPSYLHFLAEEIAKIKGIEKEKISDITTNNAKRFFNLKLQ